MTAPDFAKEARDLANATDREIAEWVVATCLTFGASIWTAYMVAGLFMQGIRARQP